MKILIAPQAFKGSLDAGAAAQATAQGIRLGWRGDLPEMTLLPLADGGEGTLDVLVQAAGGGSFIRAVTGPLPGIIASAEIGWLGQDTAVIEMAQAAGLPLIAPEMRDPLRATTRGVGEMLRIALEAGARRIIVAMGGSATNDGGAGMAQALGARLRDAAGADLPGGAALADLAAIDITGMDPRLARAEILGLTDVTNPLTGPEGASAVFGPQKGATPEQVALLDAALAHYAAIIARDLGRDVANVAGAGAAGGLGAGLLAFTHARLESGAEAVLRTVGFAERLAGCDLVIIGEGRLDGQSAVGKVTGVAARHAAAAGVPVWCVTGGLAGGFERMYDLGISAIIVASDGPRTVAEAMWHAAPLITGAVARAVRLWQSEKGRHS